jgi:O-antigen ligase
MINKLKRYLEQLANKKQMLLIYLFSIFLLKLPPLYIFPTLPSRILTTYTLAKIIIIVLFLLISMQKKLDFLDKMQKALTILFLISQSLSIISAIDTGAFLRIYHQTIISLLIYYEAIFFFSNQRNQNHLTKFLFITLVICLIFESFFFFFTPIAKQLYSYIIEKNLYDYYLYNLTRGRPHLDLNLELFLPISLYFLYFKQKKWPKYILVPSIIIIVLLSLISGFRRRSLMVIISIIISLLFVNKDKLEHLAKTFTMIGLITITIVLSFSLSKILNSYNVINRVIDENETQNYASTEFRIESLIKSIEITQSKLILGVGLGNYQLYIKKPHFVFYNNLQKDFSHDTQQNPHNVFAQILSETGIFGFFSFASLIIFFLLNDIWFYKNNQITNSFNYFLIMSFWIMLIYGMLSPFDTLFKASWFWFLRGLVINKIDNARSK